jgi:hypothetical protein
MAKAVITIEDADDGPNVSFEFDPTCPGPAHEDYPNCLTPAQAIGMAFIESFASIRGAEVTDFSGETKG